LGPNVVKIGALQLPDEHMPIPDAQLVELAALGVEQTPLVVLQVPATWQVSGAGHVTGLLPLHAPL